MKSVPLEVTMMKIIGELKAERVHDLNQIGGLQEENARLKAEVDNIRKNAEINTAQSTHELSRLKAEVERLTRAGDLMLKYASANMPYPPYVTIAKDWNAAKEGKPSV
jgi:phage host-nuclease inhibitor protein Gam